MVGLVESFLVFCWCLYRQDEWKGRGEMRRQVALFVCSGGLLEMDVWMFVSGLRLAL